MKSSCPSIAMQPSQANPCAATLRRRGCSSTGSCTACRCASRGASTWRATWSPGKCFSKFKCGRQTWGCVLDLVFSDAKLSSSAWNLRDVYVDNHIVISSVQSILGRQQRPWRLAAARSSAESSGRHPAAPRPATCTRWAPRRQLAECRSRRRLIAREKLALSDSSESTSIGTNTCCHL